MKRKKKESLLNWKMIITGIIVLIIIFGTVIGAMAYSIDNDDSFYMTKGTSAEGSFIVEGYTPDMILKSNMEWVSLDSDKYISEKRATGIKVIDENYLFSYWITVPENADIGIYRGTISVLQGDKVQYLNVKISVQSSVATSIMKAYNKPAVKTIIIVSLVMIGIIFFILAFRRGMSAVVSKR